MVTVASSTRAFDGLLRRDGFPARENAPRVARVRVRNQPHELAALTRRRRAGILLVPLFVPRFQKLERIHVRHGREHVFVLLHDVRDEGFDVFASNKVHQLQHRAVQQVVRIAVRHEHLHDRREEVVFDDVTVVELVLQTDARAEEPHGRDD